MDFTLYPAIDLKDGRCVRLVRGEMESATVFALEPGAQAAAWQAAGFEWIHVVDLNGAVEGRAVNAEAVASILKSVSVPIQLGGGIRTRRQIESWIEAGVARVILGTIAAHVMFSLPLLEASTKARTGGAQWFAEGVAAFGLIVTILAGIRFQKSAVPWLVGLYITAAYWFTASTSFANPAVAIARSMTNTFSCIRPADLPGFIASTMSRVQSLGASRPGISAVVMTTSICGASSRNFASCFSRNSGDEGAA